MTKLQKKMLIVDDDFDIRQSVRLAIHEQDFVDFHITESSTVASGIKQLEKIKPDIVILDLHFPNKSGFDFMDIMNKDKLFAEAKVIMLTIDDTFKNIFIAENKGIDAYCFLGKPFNISELQALVLEMCLPIKT